MTSTTFTPFVDLLAARTRAGASVTFPIPEDWLQGRTAYGGLIAGIATQAMHDVAGGGWPADVRLRALQTNFIGPVTVGEAAVTLQVLREGKSVRQVHATVLSQGQVAAQVLGVFGSPRTTAIEPLVPRQPPVGCAPEEAPTRPFVPGLMPGFLQHFTFGWAKGHPPFSGGRGWETSFYLRLLGDRADLIDRDVLTVLLADAPASPATSHFTQPAFASSVSWALELMASNAPVGADDWWRVDTQARSAAGGYVNHSSTLWTAGGEAAAVGHQLVTVYG